MLNKTMDFSNSFNIYATSFITEQEYIPDQTRILTQTVDCLKKEDYYPAALGDTAIKIYTDGSVKNKRCSIGIMISCGNKKEVRIASPGFYIKKDHIDAIFKKTKDMSYTNIRSLLTEIAAIKYAIYYVDTYLQRGPNLEIITDSLISKCLYDDVSFFHNKFNILKNSVIHTVLRRLLSEVNGVNVVYQKAHTNDASKSFNTTNSYGNYVADHLAKLRYPVNMTEEDILEFESIISNFDTLYVLTRPKVKKIGNVILKKY